MTVLSVENLRISYRSRGEWREVVHNVSFSSSAAKCWPLSENPARENHHRAGHYRPAGG
jgi:hypothetical protein